MISKTNITSILIFHVHNGNLSEVDGMDQTNSQPSILAALTESVLEDYRSAAKALTGARRRLFQARITSQYFGGNARLAESVLGWGRNTVALGLREAASGFTCCGAHCLSGRKRWEERFPEAADGVRALGDALGAQDATFKSDRIFTRLTAASAIAHLEKQSLPKEQIPSPSSMNNILSRLGFKLRKILKCKPKKKLPKRMPSLKTSKS